MTDHPDDELSASRRLVVEQRDANEHLVRLAIRAQEQSEASEITRELAVTGEREQRALAELRETFIGILGHDLRNPLTSILMSADALLEGRRLDAADEARVGRIVRNCGRMTRMVGQLLDLTRSRLGGGMPLVLVPVDLAELVRDVRGEFGDHLVELALVGDLTGTGDPDRLAEVVSNLIGNAIEHATRGTVVVVAAHGSATHVVVEVRNQGEAIPADVLPVLFHPFRSGGGRSAGRSRNLGLGLYISDQIVGKHGGTIAAASAGGITTFTVEIPRDPPRPRPATAPIVAPPAAP